MATTCVTFPPSRLTWPHIFLTSKRFGMVWRDALWRRRLTTQCGNGHTPPSRGLCSTSGGARRRLGAGGPAGKPTALQRLRCRIPDSPSQLWCDVPRRRPLTPPHPPATACRYPLRHYLPPRPTPPTRTPPPAAARSCITTCPGPPLPADAPPPAPARHRPLVHHLPTRPDTARSYTISRPCRHPSLKRRLLRTGQPASYSKLILVDSQHAKLLRCGTGQTQSQVRSRSWGNPRSSVSLA